MLTQLDLKAIFLGLLTYLGAYFVLGVLVTQLWNMTGQVLPWGVMVIMWFLAMSLGGFVAGYRAGRMGWLHGLVVSIAGAMVLSFLLKWMSPDLIGQETLVAFLVMGGFLNAGSGWLGQLKKNVGAKE